ncbi:MAG: hypothetical protein H0X66_02130 [Verrucomicrobia bacterium]|nr:hypothetical protein [Verrucomicrobiota bacterium]
MEIEITAKPMRGTPDLSGEQTLKLNGGSRAHLARSDKFTSCRMNPAFHCNLN